MFDYVKHSEVYSVHLSARELLVVGSESRLYTRLAVSMSTAGRRVSGWSGFGSTRQMSHSKQVCSFWMSGTS